MASCRPLTNMIGTYDVTSHAFFFAFKQIYFDFDKVVFLQLFLDMVCAFWDLLGNEGFWDSLHGEHGYTGGKRYLVADFFYVTSTALFVS